MSDENKTVEAPVPELDERAIGKKYGLRELTWPDSEQIKSLNAFLTDAVEHGRCGPVPKTAVMIVLDFLQATVNRQHITKGPRMSLNQFMEVLRSILDPGCYWMRMKTIPEGVREAMEALRDFLVAFADQRRKERAG